MIDIKNITDNALLLLHEPIQKALDEDDASPSSQPKKYGVREHDDWRSWSNELEAEMTERKVKFTPIRW